jgi:hypothetical protein
MNKYTPKVGNEIPLHKFIVRQASNTLSSSSFRVRLAGARMRSEVVDFLPANCREDNLVSLVVSLFPVINTHQSMAQTQL